MVNNDQKWSKMVKMFFFNGQKQSTLVNIGQQRSKTVKNCKEKCPKPPKTDKERQKTPKTAKNSRK